MQNIVALAAAPTRCSAASSDDGARPQRNAPTCLALHCVLTASLRDAPHPLGLCAARACSPQMGQIYASAIGTTALQLKDPIGDHRWRSPLTLSHTPRCYDDRARLVAVKLANLKEPKEARRGCAIAIPIMGHRQPGFFWLFAIGELVGDKPAR